MIIENIPNYSKEKELKSILSSVRRKFPELDEIKITTGYSDKISVVRCEIFKYIFFPQRTIDFYKIEILAPSTPSGFYKLSKKEKKAIIAHELSHVERQRKIKNFKKLLRLENWIMDSDEVVNRPETSEISGQRAKWLMRWFVLNEIYTDTQTANRGFGEGLLKYLKRFDSQDDLEIECRVKNLEKILKK